MSAPAPNDRKYLESHEWHQLDNGVVKIGITQFAIDELTDVTYLEILKETGSISAGDVFGEVESVKATSELYSGIDGQVTEVNQAVIDNPSLLNEDPFDKAWLIKVTPSDLTQLDGLLDAEAYNATHSN